jgi:hypothetical protein
MINNLVYQALLESWVISDDDFYYNFDDWINNKNKVLFIIGLSGSGKTTLGQQLANKYHCKCTSTDTIWSSILKDYKDKIGEKYYTNTKKQQDQIFDKIDTNTINSIRTALTLPFKNKTIIEGIDIIYLEKELLKNQSIIIKGSSYFKSSYQQIKRNHNDISKEGISKFLQYRVIDLKGNIINYHKIEDLKNYLKSF